MEENVADAPARGSKTGRIGDRPYWMLTLSILIRATHQVGAAVFLAVFLLGAQPRPPKAYVVAALISGVLLFAAEWMRHRQIFRELAGGITLAKLLLLGAAFHGFLPPAGAVLLAFLIASVGAHAPKHVRHRLLY